VRVAQDGFTPKPAGTAVKGAEIVVMLVPDEEQPSVYWRAVEPNLSDDALVVFARGHALYAGTIEPCRTDVVLVARDDDGPCRVAVHHDRTGRALERALEYARLAFGNATGAGTTTIAQEVEADLEEKAKALGGRHALLAIVDEQIHRARSSHEADEVRLAYLEGMRSILARPTAFPPPAASQVSLSSRAPRLRAVR
jgi:ketol-acid reductoisomerase